MAGNTQSAMAGDAYKTAAAIKKNPNERTKAQKIKENTTKSNKLKDSISYIKNYEIALAQANIKSAEKVINEKQKEINAYVTLHGSESGYPSAEDTSIINTKKSLIAIEKKEINLNNKKITDFNNKLKVLQKQYSELNPLFFPSAGLGGNAPTSIKNGSYLKGSGDGEKKAFSKDYKYNAPMVNAAYFGVQSFQDNILGNNRVDPGAYTDARNAWSGVTGGRGTIQMDKKLLQASNNQLSTQNDTLDLQKYGFKFLYNPTTVSMAWGLMNYMDPPFEASGADVFSVVSAGLMTSTVEFELILNRIEDFSYLNENGLSSQNPYSVTVPNDDLKAIYRQGTMYDMEYLLKTLNGPSSVYTSELNGLTSDRAWLRPTIVELHLGSAMRYRVRIADLSINHIMFDSRMVPILSSVRIKCSRFNDGPTAMPSNAIVGSHKPYADKRIQN